MKQKQNINQNITISITYNLYNYKDIKSHENQKVCYICETKFCYAKNKKSSYKLYHKVRDHCHYNGKFRGAPHNICNLRYNVPKKIPVVFHNGSKYNYDFVIKKLADKFKGELECLGENTEKYITFLVPLKKEDDNDNDKVKESHIN